ncbi:peptidoglycan DD-metalloendopeptidase family protein [Geothrix fuzhouensis]|uniref:peptidoglycan DD-metalloendopeptidase family protein n=1 Tax=Geothrix fuzhouensis TaxID=2966451 RepID=UPI0021494E13|nr:peptidoglycan DD-metalloendopeptidase family protein [Geothrix fuzhouensis]
MTLARCRVAALLMVVATGRELTGAEPAPLPFKPSPVPGGVVVVALPGGPAAPKATYRGEPVLVRRSGRSWTAVVGIPLSAKPGRHEIAVEGRPVTFTVRAKRYPEQRIRLKDQRQVTPNAEDEARIAREQALMGPAWKAWPEGLAPTLRFQQPTPGGLTSSFGLRRIFNGQPRAPHAGLDIKAPAGQAVRAPAAGMVVLTGDFFFSGNAVFLAHGEGVVSLFAHLSKITVTQGQVVKPGDLLGEVGMTGRATGPHLHWSLSLNNARVDPRLFL